MECCRAWTMRVYTKSGFLKGLNGRLGAGLINNRRKCEGL